jgi:hypothetical protein
MAVATAGIGVVACGVTVAAARGGGRVVVVVVGHVGEVAAEM